MKFTLLFLLFFSISFNICHGEESEEIVALAALAEQNDPELKNLQWNRYVEKNFVILSIDDEQGRWLSKNIDSIADWCLQRWGIQGATLSKECRIFCVPNKPLLKKLFQLEDSKVELKKSDNNSKEVSAIWVCLDPPSKESIAPYITRIVFAENNQSYPFWFSRSAEILSSSLDNIKTHLDQNITTEEKVLELFSVNHEKYAKMNVDSKKKFDKQALILCLMLRKELGQRKLLSFIDEITKNDLESSLKKVYGYKNLEDFNKKLNNYNKDFVNEFNLGKVPVSYFLIKEAN
jgi:hypothetical protein